jgi:hypothetical protein
VAAEPPPLPLEPEDYRRWQRVALGAGAAGLVLCAAGWAWQPATFLRSYLWAYLFWLGIALGSLVLAMLQWLTGGVWGLVLRRSFEAAGKTIPLLALLFAPVLLGLHELYPWADPEYFAHAHGPIAFKRWYLSPPVYIGFSIGYFVIWTVLAYLVAAWSVREDRPGAADPRHLRMLSAGGLVLYGLTITSAATHWIMSLEPRWFSSIFGALVGIGQVLTAFAFAVAVMLILRDRPPLDRLLGRPLLRDFGSLMLAFVMVWAYMSFSQFLLIWSGNLPPEIVYYLRRGQNGWEYVAALIALFHFAVPFAALLSREVKRTPRLLIRVAVLILVMRMVDLFWKVKPADPGPDGHHAPSFSFDWTDVVAPVGIGGVWLAFFLLHLQQRPVVPAHDPHLEEAYHHE